MVAIANLFTKHPHLRAVIDAVLEGRQGTIHTLDEPPSAARLDLGCYHIPGGVGALNLTVSGQTGLSLALSGDGTDLLLTGGTGTPGDFNSDGYVDGLDFLMWQRGESPLGGTQAELTEWENNYGAQPLSAATAAVPEPSSVLLVLASVAMFGLSRGSRPKS